MNRLSQTKIYNSIEKHFGIKGKGLTNTIIELDIPKYEVPREFYEDLIYQYKGFKYPLSTLTFESSKNNNIFPILLADPVDKIKDKPLNNEIPQAIFTFLRPGNNGNFYCYVDCSLKSGYDRNTDTNKTIKNYKVKLLHFYTFMQFAAVRRMTHIKEESINKATALLNKFANFYSHLTCKIIDRKYAISANADDYIILKFIANCFFLENMALFPKEKAIENTLRNPYFSKYDTIISGGCNYINQGNKYNMNKAFDNNRYPIDEFVDICQDQFKQMEGKFNYRTFTYDFLNFFSLNSNFALEDFNSFLILLQSGYLKPGIFNDLGIADTLGTSLGETLKDLDLLLSK